MPVVATNQVTIPQIEAQIKIVSSKPASPERDEELAYLERVLAKHKLKQEA
jgi:hypothetical protein